MNLLKNCAVFVLSFFVVALGGGSASAQVLPPLSSSHIPPGVPILSSEIREFAPYGSKPDTFTCDLVPAQERPFSEALRLTEMKEPANSYDYGITSKLTGPIHTGDVLWVSLQLRCIKTLRENGEAQAEIALLQQVNGKEVRPLQRVISFGANWTRFDLPFVVQNDSEVGQARIGLRFGFGMQTFEVGGVTLLNYGPNANISDLPRSHIRYDGWSPDAPWRKAAAERIEKFRKGDLWVRVVDAAGKPVPGADVQVRMKRHAFGWGTAIQTERITDTTNPENVRYRQTVEAYFNKVVFDNDLKWGRWIQPKTKAQVLAALPWLKARNIAVRGHVMLWPSWEHLPQELFSDAVKSDPASIRKLVSDHISDQTGALRGQLAEWDVANETYRHHDLLDILGRGELADWYRQAKAQAPDVKLFYNDYTMFQKGEGAQYFYDTVKSLRDSGAPIDAIGEQGHFGSSPPGIPDVLATLDKFGELGLPIQISEFDIDSDDAGLQADFMRDFITAVFSHPAVMGVVQWGFWQKAHWLPRAALWDNDWNLRPHGKVWVDLVTKTWWTNADGQTDHDGNYRTRGFYGDYEITVSQGTQSHSVLFSLSPPKGVLTVTLP